MRIIFVGKEDVDLLETLMNSETSRIILRFYSPQKHPCGIQLSLSSLGIALSLVSELRWYRRRYMAGVLFELQEGIFGTYGLAKEVYERDIRLDGEGIRRSLYGLQDGRFRRIEDSPSHLRSPGDPSVTEDVLEVWSLEQETAETDEDTGDGDEPGENHFSEGM